MKKKSLIQKIGLFSLSAILAMSVLSLTGCGSTKSTEGSAKDDSEVQTISVALPTDFDKISVLNEKGELEGFEVDLFKKIDEELDKYEFEYVESSFDNILIQLDTGKIDIGSCEYEWSEERAEKYLFANEGFRNYDSYIVSLDPDITSLEDLAGKTLGSWGSTDNVVLQLEKYNKKNPDKAIKFEDISELDNNTRIEALKAGRIDALYDNIAYYQDYVDTFGDIFTLGDAIYESNAYFLYPKDGQHEQLRDDIDVVLKQFHEDGTLNELLQNWYGINAFED